MARARAWVIMTTEPDGLDPWYTSPSLDGFGQMTSPCASVSPSGTLGYNSPYLREIRTQWVNDCNVLPLVAAHGVGSLYQNALTAPPPTTFSWP